MNNVKVRAPLNEGEMPSTVEVNGNFVISRDWCSIAVNSQGYVSGIPVGSKVTFFDYSDPTDANAYATKQLDEVVIENGCGSFFVFASIGTIIHIPLPNPTSDRKFLVVSVVHEKR